MPTPPLPLNVAQEAVKRVEDQLRQGCVPKGMHGGRSAIEAAAELAAREGFVRTANAFASRLEAAKRNYRLEPDWSIFRPHRYSQPVPRQVLQPAIAHNPSLYQPTGDAQRILVLGDLHNDPRHPDRLQVLTWAARYASEHKFDRIIQVGDWSTWDSVNQHDKNDTYASRFKPGIRDDLDNLTATHQAFRRGMAEGYKPKLDFLLGNHENRVERFENANPESVGTFSLARDETFAQFGWRTRPYGELFYTENVAFTHHPINGAGKAFGGETGPQRAAAKTTVPVVSGHTHKRQLHDAAKIGPVDSIAMVEVGCGLLWGEVENYAKHGMTGWWYGFVPMTVQGGVITDVDFVSMLKIRNRYSDHGGDIRSAA